MSENIFRHVRRISGPVRPPRPFRPLFVHLAHHPPLPGLYPAQNYIQNKIAPNDFCMFAALPSRYTSGRRSHMCVCRHAHHGSSSSTWSSWYMRAKETERTRRLLHSAHQLTLCNLRASVVRSATQKTYMYKVTHPTCPRAQHVYVVEIVLWIFGTASVRIVTPSPPISMRRPCLAPLAIHRHPFRRACVLLAVESSAQRCHKQI